MSTKAQGRNPGFVLKAVKSVVIEERPIRELKPKEVRVHVRETGICGSDVHHWQHGRIGKYALKEGEDMVLGHEGAGVIAEMGLEVKGLDIGDRVAIEPGVPCRYCTNCLDGKYNHCADMIFAASPPYDGTLAKYYIIDYDFCYKIPDSMNLEEAALIEPTSVAVQVCKRAKLKGTDSVVVFGCGPIGLLCQGVSKALGCKKVIGVDISEGRLMFAKTYAADGVYKMPFRNDDETEEQFAIRISNDIKNEFSLGSEGADVILEATGAGPCIQAGIFLSAPQGRFVQAGMGKEFMNFPVTEALIKELNWTGVFRYTSGCYSTAIDLVSSGKLNVKKLVTNRFNFMEAEKAFELAKEGRSDVIKIIIHGFED